MRRLVSAFLAGFLLTVPASAQNTLFPANPGDMIVKGTAGAWVPVPGGTAGCVLTSNGPTAIPTFNCALALNFQLPPMAPNTVWGNVTAAQAVGAQINISQFLNTIDFDVQRPPLPGATIYKGTDNAWHTAPPAAPGWVWTSEGNGQIPRWAAPGLAPGTFTPEQFEASCDNATDNTAAFGRLFAAVTAAGAGTIELASAAPDGTANCKYLIYSSVTPAVGPNFLGLLTGLKKLTINFNGASIATPFNFSTASIIYPIYLYHSSNVTINNPKFDQPNYHTPNFDRGITAIGTEASATEGSDNLIVNNLEMNGGTIGVSCVRAVSGPRSNGVVINNANLKNVFYGFAAQKGCDNTHGNITTENASRSYFPYNVSNHHVQVKSDASGVSGGYNDILIVNYYDSADTTPNANVTDDIWVNYTNIPGATSGVGVNTYATIQFATSGGSAEGFQQISNIHLDLNVERLADIHAGPLLGITSGTTTAQGRLLENIFVTGSIKMQGSAVFMHLMDDKDWTGDNVRNLQINNMTCRYVGAPAALSIDGRSIIGPVVLNSIHGNGNCTYSATNMAGAFKYLSYNQVWLPGLITPGAVTAANLPTCDANNVGTRYSVSDANATTFHSVVAGGGANIVDVVCLNSNWTIGG